MINYEEVKERLRQIIPLGLTAGLGSNEPGKMCVEAAICFALSEPHSEQPSCVSELDRRFSIVINDAGWSSPLVRAEALLPLAIAQLGTLNTSRRIWVTHIILGTIKRVLPLALDAVGMTDHAQACRNIETLDDAKVAVKAAEKSLSAATGTLAAAYAFSAAVAVTAVEETNVAAAANAAIFCSNATFYSDTANFNVTRDAVLCEAVAIALDAYKAEGR